MTGLRRPMSPRASTLGCLFVPGRGNGRGRAVLLLVAQGPFGLHSFQRAGSADAASGLSLDAGGLNLNRVWALQAVVGIHVRLFFTSARSEISRAIYQNCEGETDNFFE